MAGISTAAIRCEPAIGPGSQRLRPIYHAASGVLVGHPAAAVPFVKGITAYPLLLDLDEQNRIVHFELILRRDLWTVGEVFGPRRVEHKDLVVATRAARNTIDADVAVVTNGDRSQVQVTIGEGPSASSWYALSDCVYAGVTAGELRSLVIARFEIAR